MYDEFPLRSHFTLGEEGWEQVADYALTWAAENAAVRQQPATILPASCLHKLLDTIEAPYNARIQRMMRRTLDMHEHTTGSQAAKRVFCCGSTSTTSGRRTRRCWT